MALGSCVQNTPTDPYETLGKNELPKSWPKSTKLEAEWGAPQGPFRSVLGVATKRYKDPHSSERYVEVSYLGQDQPREIRNFDGTRAVDGQLQVMGQTVDFYGSGNEVAEISTQPIWLTSPNGWSGWFVFTYSPEEYRKGRNLPQFSW